MAEKLCELRKKGGGGEQYSETVLWTNPSPDTRMPASDSTISASVTLSDSLSNYEYVKFKFKRNNSAYADSYTDVIYSVEEFKKYLASTAYAFRGSITAFTNNTNVQITKKFSYVDDTTVMFVHTMSGTNSAGSYTQIIYDETLIPNQIVGIKVALPPSVGNVKTGTFTSPTSGNTITITCGFEPKKIYLTMYASSSKLYTVGYDIAMDSTHQMVGWRSSSSSADCTAYAFPNSSNNGVLVSISSTGFVYKAGTTTANQTIYYTVIG